MDILLYNFLIKILLELNNHIILIASICYSFLFITLIVNVLKFSDNKSINFLQKYSLQFLFICLISLIYIFIFIPIIYCTDNGDINLISKAETNNVTLTSNITINKESVVKISDSLSNAFSNVGLGTSIGGVATAVSTALKSAPIPPVQKVGLIILGGSAGGVIHTAVSAIKKNRIESINTKELNNRDTENIPSPSSIYPSSINEEGNLFGDSPLEELLFSILSLNLINLILMFFLIFNLLNRYFLNKELKLNWIGSIISIQFKNILKNFILKLLKSNKQVNLYYLIIIFVILISCQISSVYFLSELINNLESFCKGYLKYLLSK